MATRRTVLIVNLILSLFFLMNVISIWAGLNLYPGGWRFVLMGAVMGNLLWLLIPMILKRQSSPFLRVSRAILGPLWVFWTLLVFLYSCF
ncbi:MAG TPA: hypothetical protein VK859_08790, partial [bacterium]|nr:hypothetical protein [bacterium]